MLPDPSDASSFEEASVGEPPLLEAKESDQGETSNLALHAGSSAIETSPSEGEKDPEASDSTDMKAVRGISANFILNRI